MVLPNNYLFNWDDSPWESVKKLHNIGATWLRSNYVPPKGQGLRRDGLRSDSWWNSNLQSLYPNKASNQRFNRSPLYIRPSLKGAAHAVRFARSRKRMAARSGLPLPMATPWPRQSRPRRKRRIVKRRRRRPVLRPRKRRRFA